MIKTSKQSITPFLWYDGNAVEAAKFYCLIFKGSKILNQNAVSATFKIMGQTLIAFNGGPLFKFTPAVSFFVTVSTQKEVDHYWKKLSKGGELSRCGWLKDKYGLSWQVIPDCLGKMLTDKDPVKAGRVMKAMMGMIKIDIKGLKRAYDGK